MTTVQLIFAIIGAVVSFSGLTVTLMSIVLKKAKKNGIDAYRLAETEQKIKELPCKEHKEKIAALEDLKTLALSTNEMVVKIRTWVCEQDQKMIAPLTQKFSPTKLTPVGEIVLSQSKGKEAVDANLDFFITEVEKLMPKVALDVENGALKVLSTNLENEMFNEVKNFIYAQPELLSVEDPTSKQPVDVILSLPSLIQAMSIYLRDKYFEKHPEIDIKDFIPAEAAAE